MVVKLNTVVGFNIIKKVVKLFLEIEPNKYKLLIIST